jgi:hypothetical protein
MRALIELISRGYDGIRPAVSPEHIAVRGGTLIFVAQGSNTT